MTVTITIKDKPEGGASIEAAITGTQDPRGASREERATATSWKLVEALMDLVQNTGLASDVSVQGQN